MADHPPDKTGNIATVLPEKDTGKRVGLNVTGHVTAGISTETETISATIDHIREQLERQLQLSSAIRTPHHTTSTESKEAAVKPSPAPTPRTATPPPRHLHDLRSALEGKTSGFKPLKGLPPINTEVAKMPSTHVSQSQYQGKMTPTHTKQRDR